MSSEDGLFPDAEAGIRPGGDGIGSLSIAANSSAASGDAPGDRSA